MDGVAGSVTFGVLGPVVAEVGGRRVELTSSTRRLLAVLLAAPGHTVGMDTIVAQLWDDQPPAGAEGAVHTYVSRLRRALRDAGAPDDALLTRMPGYALLVEPGSVDAHRFSSLVSEARHALDAGRPTLSLRVVDEALRLWRGTPYEDIGDTSFARSQRLAWDQAGLDAQELGIAARLALGEDTEAVIRAEELLRRHPYHEPLWARLVLALYRASGQAAALAAYTRARRLLVDDLGIEPGAALRDLHGEVLRQSPALDLPRATPTPVPDWLLGHGSVLYGREAELAVLHEQFETVARRGSATVWLAGPAGSGRTRLAVELARQADACGVAVRWGRGAFADSDPPLRLRIVDDGSPVTDTGHRDTAVLTVVVCGEAPRGAGHVVRLGPLPETAIADLVRPYGVGVGEVAAAGGLPGPAHGLARAGARSEVLVRAAACCERADIRDPRGRTVEELRTLVRRLVGVRRAAAVAGGTRRPRPFPGLVGFEAADADLFHGRDDLVAELVARLAGHSLVAVVGASGAGKSSAVRAGLLPLLADGLLPGSDGWSLLVGAPGVLGRTGIEQHVRDAEPGLVVIDQFEEAFTLLPARDRVEFIDAVVKAVHDGFRVVLTIRSEFYGRCADHAQLADLVSAATVLVPTMSADDIRQAVTMPARVLGFGIEPALSEAVVAEAAGRPGALPLMSTALLASWERRSGPELTFADYRASGGVGGAVERLAEAAYGQLDTQAAGAARDLLLRLADTGDDGQPVRRRADLAEVRAGGPATERALAAFVERRLISTDGDAVEVAHEALLTGWTRMADWLAEDRAGLALRRRLAAATADWVGSGRDPALLWRSARLVAAAEHAGGLSGAEEEFVRAGLAARDAEVTRQRRANRRLRMLAATMATVLVLAVIAGAVALHQRDRATAAGVLADARRMGALAQVEPDPRRSMMEAVAGVMLHDSWETRGNLLAALQRGSPDLVAGGGVDLGDRINAIAVDGPGDTVAIGSVSGTIVLYDAATLTPRRSLHHPGSVFGLQFRADGDLVSWGGDHRPPPPSTSPDPSRPPGEQGGVIIWDPATGRPTGPPFGPDVVAYGGIGGDALFTLDGDHVSRVDLDAPHTVVEVASGPFYQVVADANGTRLATGGPDGVFVVDTATGARRRVGADMSPMAFSPDGRLLLGEDHSALVVFDAATGRRLAAASGHTGHINDAAWSADGHRAVSCSEDRTVRTWSVGPDGAGVRIDPIATYPGLSGRPQACRFGLAGGAVYSGGLDGIVLAFDTTGRRGLSRPVRPPDGRDYSYARGIGALAVTVSENHDGESVSSVDLATGAAGQPPVGLGRMFNPSVSDDGRYVFDIDRQDQTVRVDSPDGRLLAGPIRPPATYTTGVGMTRDGRQLLIGVSGNELGDGARIHRYDLAAGAYVGSPLPVPEPVWSFATSPDGAYVAAGADSGQVRVWSTADWKQVAAVPGQLSASADQLVFSPDGRYLAVGGSSGRLSVWDVADWHLVWRAGAGHNGQGTSVAFSPDGELVASSGTDAKTMLFETATGTPVGRPIGPDETRWTMASFLPGTHTLAIFVDDGSVRHWDVDPVAWLRRACAIAGRGLTPDEWHQLLPDRPYQPECLL